MTWACFCSFQTRARCSSKDNFRNDGGVKNSPMPALEFTKTFVIVRNPDFQAPVVREFDILGTPNPKLVTRKGDDHERFERVRPGQFSQLINHPGTPSTCSLSPHCRANLRDMLVPCQKGSVADRSIPHAASTLYHTWNGSVPKLSGRPNWPLMIL
jgi:hypothetical protein